MLETIQKQKPLPPFVVVHGLPGAGKTSFGASATKPVFIKTEEGAGKIELEDGSFTGLDYDSFPLSRSYDDALAAVKALGTSEHDYKTLVIDTISGIESLCGDKVAESSGYQTFEAIPHGAGYGSMRKYFADFLTKLDKLRAVKGMNICVLCHSRITEFTPPETGQPYNQYQLELDKRNAPNLQKIADNIFFLNEKTLAASKNQATKGLGFYCFTKKKPAYIAKNRFNLPDEIQVSQENGWRDVFSLINKKENK